MAMAPPAPGSVSSPQRAPGGGEDDGRRSRSSGVHSARVPSGQLPPAPTSPKSPGAGRSGGGGGGRGAVAAAAAGRPRVNTGQAAPGGGGQKSPRSPRTSVGGAAAASTEARAKAAPPARSKQGGPPSRRPALDASDTRTSLRARRRTSELNLNTSTHTESTASETARGPRSPSFNDSAIGEAISPTPEGGDNILMSTGTSLPLEGTSSWRGTDGASSWPGLDANEEAQGPLLTENAPVTNFMARSATRPTYTEIGFVNPRASHGTEHLTGFVNRELGNLVQMGIVDGTQEVGSSTEAVIVQEAAQASPPVVVVEESAVDAVRGRLHINEPLLHADHAEVSAPASGHHWSTELCHNLGTDPASFQGKAPLLTGFEGVSAAVQALRSAKRNLPSGVNARGFCVIFHAHQQAYFLIYRSDKAREVGELFGFEPVIQPGDQEEEPVPSPAIASPVVQVEFNDDLADAQIQRLFKDTETMEILALRLCEALQKDEAAAAAPPAKRAAFVEEERDCLRRVLIDVRGCAAQLADVIFNGRVGAGTGAAGAGTGATDGAAGDELGAARPLMARLQALLSESSVAASLASAQSTANAAALTSSGHSFTTSGTGAQVFAPGGTLATTYTTSRSMPCTGSFTSLGATPKPPSPRTAMQSYPQAAVTSVPSPPTAIPRTASLNSSLAVSAVQLMASPRALTPHTPQLAYNIEAPSRYSIPATAAPYLGMPRAPITPSRSLEPIIPLAAAEPLTSAIIQPMIQRSVTSASATRGRSISPACRFVSAGARSLSPGLPLAAVGASQRSLSPPAVRLLVAAPPQLGAASPPRARPASPARPPLAPLAAQQQPLSPMPAQQQTVAGSPQPPLGPPGAHWSSCSSLGDGRVVRRHYTQRWVLDYEETVEMPGSALPPS